MREKKFSPEHAVTYYQSRCTNCGVIEEDYDTFSAFADEDSARCWVVENGWVELWKDRELSELLCPKCQTCDLCDQRGYEVDDRVVCSDHEGVLDILDGGKFDG